jgi:hypothetical protein
MLIETVTRLAASFERGSRSENPTDIVNFLTETVTNIFYAIALPGPDLHPIGN